MAHRWVKSLHCKSRAVDDVYMPLQKPPPPLHPIASCRNSFQGLKDVVARSNPIPPSKPKPKLRPDNPPPKPAKNVSVFSVGVPFPSLSDLPEGHPSRNVVEIIFHTRWSSKSAFLGRVEMVFKIHNPAKTLTRFEEYREAVKARCAVSNEEHVIRCVADGNEMMRFFCLGPTSSGLVDGRGGFWEINGGGKSTASGGRIGTFSGSGEAHDSAGGGRGRRAMLVCRVIAGRVAKRVSEDPINKRYDSAKGENGELLVFDARAVLPCFLVIYKL